MANVVYEHVSKKFGEVSAVSDLSIEVRDGEFLVLVGPSGCGKSTTLRLVAGLEEITAGNIFIGDRKVNDVAPKDRDIAMVFQSYALYPHMSVYDNLAFGLRLRKVPKNEIDRRVRSTGEMLGISELLDRKPKQLSGGQRQRVAVGRAIVRDPQVFLLDEPLSNLDAKLRIQTRAELTKLHQRLKTTTIYVTHDQTEAMTMGTRIAVLKDGLLQQLDTPQQLYDKPRNMFVAGFIGSPSMNFFDAGLEGSAADLWVKTRAFKVKVPNQLAPELAKYKDRDLVFGLRPEDFSDSTLLTTKNPDQTVNVDVDVVELMGSETYVYMVNEGSTFIGRFDPRSKVQPGMKIQTELDMGNMHLFDRQTQEALV